MKGHQISYTVNRANIAVELFQFSFGTDSNTLVDVIVGVDHVMINIRVYFMVFQLAPIFGL